MSVSYLFEGLTGLPSFTTVFTICASISPMGMLFLKLLFVSTSSFEQRRQGGNEHYRAVEVYFPTVIGSSTNTLRFGSNDIGHLPSQPRLAIPVGASVFHYFEGIQLDWTLPCDEQRTFFYYGRKYFSHASQSVLSILYVYTYDQEGSNWEDSFFDYPTTFDSLVSHGRLHGSSVAKQGDADQAATTDHGPALSWKLEQDQGPLRRGRNNFHVKMDSYTTEVSKLLPKSYLDDGSTSYNVADLKFTPAEVARHLVEDGLSVYAMSSRDPQKRKDHLIEEEEEEEEDEEEKVREVGESSFAIKEGFKKISEMKNEITKYFTRDYWQISETDFLFLYLFLLLNVAMVGLMIVVIIINREFNKY